MRFSFYRFRFWFEAHTSLFFPTGKAGNVLRGSFGSAFKRIVCSPECKEARTCERKAECPYARIFEPAAVHAGPSGFADLPRPFVFRASQIDGRSFPPGTQFSFDLHLFDVRQPAIAYFALTFAELARDGFGPGHGRAELLRVEQLDLNNEPMAELSEQEVAPLSVELDRRLISTETLSLRFVTPTELKHGEVIAREPDFGILLARVRDRLSALSSLYGEGPLEIDFKAFGERAAAVRMTRCQLEHVDAMRRSSRTGQTHALGGFVGEAEYEGEVTEFIPYLEAARFSGVGRHTTWGKGELAIVSNGSSGI